MPLDDIDRRIVMALQRDARVPYAELARQVGLTAPAVADRIRKLESSGVVRGYHAHIDLAAAARPIVAFVRISTSPDSGRAAELTAYADTATDILELHRVTGGEDFIARAALGSIEALERLVIALSEFGRTTTSIVLSSPVGWREVPF